MMRDNRAAALAHDRGMGDPFGVAHFHNVVDDVVAVLLQRVVGGTVEARARAIIIHPEPAPDIEVTQLVPQLQ